MNSAILGGLVRHLLTIGGRFFASKGIIDNNQLEQLVAALVMILGISWSIWQKRQAASGKGQAASGQALQILALTSFLLPLTLLVGCRSIPGTIRENDLRIARDYAAKTLAAGPEGAPGLAVNLLSLLDGGYWQAWKDTPGNMTIAHAELGGGLALGGYAINAAGKQAGLWGKKNKSSSSSSSSSTSNSDDHSNKTDQSQNSNGDKVYTINAGGDVTINDGSSNGKK